MVAAAALRHRCSVSDFKLEAVTGKQLALGRPLGPNRLHLASQQLQPPPLPSMQRFQDAMLDCLLPLPLNMTWI
jgi:hypothetical protein